MAELGPLALLYAAVVLVLSFALRGSAGFGGLNAPLLVLVVPPKIMIPALVMLGILSSWAIVARDWRHIEWKAVRQVLPYGFVGIAIGAWMFKTLDPAFILKGLGVFVIGYGLNAMWRSTRPPAPLRAAPHALAAVMGTISGFIGTLFGALAGVFVAVFLDLLRLDKRAFRVTMAATLLVMGIGRTVGFAAVGAIGQDVLIAFAASLPLMGLGVVLGHRIHANLDPFWFARLVAMLFVVTGTLLLLR